MRIIHIRQNPRPIWFHQFEQVRTKKKLEKDGVSYTNRSIICQSE